MTGVQTCALPIYFEDLDKDVTVIIALHWSEDVIKAMLIKAGYRGNILRIVDLTGEK